jgi:putative transposase
MEPGVLFRKAQAALLFEFKENFKIKDVLPRFGNPAYHHHIKMMKKENPDQKLRNLFNLFFDNI